jgi:hypothetical protein
MNEEMKVTWLEISEMLGEPTPEELSVFLRTWQRAIQAEREECAKLCEKMWHRWLDSPEENEPNKPDAEDCYRAIRARGQA